MTAKELKSALTVDDIKFVIEFLGGTVYLENDECLICDTFCHGGNSHKLYYYKSSQTFYCYTECGSFDIIQLVIQLKSYSVPEAINWLAVKCNIELKSKGSFGKISSTITDWSFIHDYESSKKQIKSTEPSNYDTKILNIFQNKYYKGWIDEGISINTMEKYSIKYSSFLRQIIIPHYDISNKLIGIRGRMMTKEDEKNYGKYSPVKIGNTIYNHALSCNLYGIHKNLIAVKNKHKVMLVEGEKSVLQADSMFGDDNFTLALCGSNLSSYQLDLLLLLGVKEIIIGLDKQFQSPDTEEALLWQKHIFKRFVKPLAPYFAVYIIWDNQGLLEYKQSPTDKGKEILLKLMKNKIYIPSVE